MGPAKILRQERNKENVYVVRRHDGSLCTQKQPQTLTSVSPCHDQTDAIADQSVTRDMIAVTDSALQHEPSRCL